jgi:hypothetical protein
VVHRFTSWRKSTRSEGVDCVEVSIAIEATGLRDSKNADGPVLSVPTHAWQALLTALR